MTHMYRGLKHHILKAGLIPVLTLSLTLSVLSTVLALYQTNFIFKEQVRTSASQIALLATTAVELDDLQTIQKVARASLQQSGLRGVRVSNNTGVVLYQAGPPFLVQDWPHSPALRAPYLEKDNAILITSRMIPPEKDHGLWLELEYNTSATLLNKYQWILLGSLICTLCMLLATVFNLRLGNSIAVPLEHITTAISQIRFADLSARIPSGHPASLDVLVRHINSLLAKMQASYREMKDEVDIVADELQKNMETLELNNAELDLSRKLAIQANEAKSVFLANMSHEMRTPLNSISGYAELLKRSHLEDSQKEHLRTLTTAADSLLAIIDDILDFAKLEAGKLVLKNAPLNLRTVVDEVLAMSSPSAQKKGLELAALMRPDLPVQLTGDANRLKQILSNLVSNAIKFTNSGSVAIQVTCDKLSKSHASLRISVEDSGIGIRQEDARKLFKAFSQVNSTRNRNNHGTGLGLVICKSLIEQMQGTIDFDSQPGRGTRFWFTLRLPINHRAETPAPEARGQAALIESRPQSQKGISQLLQSEGFSAQAIDHPSKINTIEGSQPSLMVLGYQPNTMPPLTDYLRDIPEGCKTLILTDADYLETLSSQVNSHNVMLLSRPLSQLRLRESLSKLFPEKSEFQHPLPLGDKVIQSLRKLRILAVDDNEPNLILLDTILSDAGITTDTATSGQEALNLIAKHSYDMVFMDIQMPGMDGLEATRQLRQNEKQGEHLPVIALTAHALAEEQKELMKAGMNDYLTKPVSEQQLLHIISDWADKPRNSEPVQQRFQNSHETLLKSDSQAPVNRNEGIKLAGGREDLADELLGMLLGTLEATREDLVNYHHLNNTSTLLAEVHKLHGAARYCGTPPLRTACHELENRIKQASSESNQAVDIDELFDTLLEEIDRLLIWRERFAPEEIASA
ncbi:response regulator [Parendozoicomonas sp. Alg238-R29]|uniref:response regulator n=1 Tax=Parendozoicomonas sp. Alg238-R29 TaxID=2993446 RepID=UPI00248E45D6|nr:response regulator [Parendozoicomonas sp. Alg238-R29]